ncbi:uncharacterized protein LOC133806027 [Humulus lupulus]|uniref:uncharacterized protein LOC133806027 n=1 Tax=Humulus lupulus TaxID=3486 RepID=UPI002B40B9D2|nr:uncharacterized protein LOC133806027 [Humulus lupulus]
MTILEKMRQQLHTSVDQKCKYADQQRRSLTFEVRDKVFLKVALLKGAMPFNRKGKLSPWHIGPYETLERIGEVAYHLALPPALSLVHDISHVSKLRKYIDDPSHVLSYEEIIMDPKLYFEEKPVVILD